MVEDWIQAFLLNRHFRFRVDRQGPDPRSGGSGIPKGLKLGPTIFLLFVNDLPDVLEGKVLLFADGAKIIVPRSDLNIPQQYLRVGQKPGHSQSMLINVFTFQLVNVLLYHCMMVHR